ncbi:hypothetical protein ACWEH1_14690 [Micromonospora chersina]
MSDPALMLPGDLVLIPGSEGTLLNPRHVGMYLGRGSSSTPRRPTTSSRSPG